MQTIARQPRRTGLENHEASELFDRRLACLMLRLAIGFALFMHGVTRIFVIGDVRFAAGIVRQMAHTPLPPALAHPYALVLPFGELTIGFLLLAGLWSRWIPMLGVLLMLSLMFGSGLNYDWQGVMTQLFYAVVFFLLLFFRSYNVFSVDAWISGRARETSSPIGR